MIGNRLGWSLAAVLAVVLGLIAWQLAGVNRLTAPTSLLNETRAFEPLASEVPPSAVYRYDTPGDSGPLYRQAIDAVRRDASRYETAAMAETPDDFEASDAWAALRAAAPLTGDAGLTKDPAIRAGYDGAADDDVDALVLAARCLGHTAQLRSADSPEQARALYEAQFALGAKLFDARIRYAETATALTIARDASRGLRDLADRAADPRRASAAAAFDRSAEALLLRLGPVWGATAAIDGRVIARHCGDVYALADAKTVERVWRVEAVLALGRHRFNAERAADRLVVPRRLAELERVEKDPFVLAAIQAARGLTIEQYRTLR
ncbi:MAG TPA: hypothetical protein VF595_07215 [Tepidisphaeraceae bacterium]|jgi:hypothetical protein